MLNQVPTIGLYADFTFDSIEKIYQTFQTMFHQLAKHLEFHQK